MTEPTILENADEALRYLYQQIDPRDRNNPKYDDVWKAISGVIEAKARIARTKPIRFLVRDGKIEPYTGTTDDPGCRCVPLNHHHQTFCPAYFP